jgi:Cu2+-exporting ATPase
LTGTVLIHFNPRQIQKSQLVALLDGALEKTEDFAHAPIDYDLPVSTAAVALSGRHLPV